MEPLTIPTKKRRLLDKVVITGLVGVGVVSMLAVALFTIYLNRLDDAATGLRRVAAVRAYAGRPSAVVDAEGEAATNFLILASQNGELKAILIAHLSASRRDLTLVALPADLITNNLDRQTLAQTYAINPVTTTRSVETLTGALMDHQIHLDLDHFAQVVNSVGGVSVSNQLLDGTSVLDYLGEQQTQADRSALTAVLIRESLIRAQSSSGILNPTRFSRIMDAVTPCVQVDAGLTPALIEATVMESRVHANEVTVQKLAVTQSSAGSYPSPLALSELRQGLANDDLNISLSTQSAAALPTPTASR